MYLEKVMLVVDVALVLDLLAPQCAYMSLLLHLLCTITENSYIWCVRMFLVCASEEVTGCLIGRGKCGKDFSAQLDCQM